jgi:hypothetical protein
MADGITVVTSMKAAQGDYNFARNAGEFNATWTTAISSDGVMKFTFARPNQHTIDCDGCPKVLVAAGQQSGPRAPGLPPGQGDRLKTRLELLRRGFLKGKENAR